jgi:hypothetical protein
MAQEPNNYVLGSGELWFDPFIAGTKTPKGELYFGNTPEWNITAESETQDHYDADHGAREKDASATLQVNRSGNVITDNISAQNVAYFFFGSKAALTVAPATISNEVIAAAVLGSTYQLGTSASNPVGVQKVSAVTVTDVTDATTYAADTDYEINLDTGRIQILEGGSIVEDDVVHVNYTLVGYTIERVISGGEPIEGAMRYIEFNVQGANRIWYMPHVKISPNGDYSLKGDDWQQIPLSVEVLKKTGLQAIYIDNVAV